MSRSPDEPLLLGEWACLGILCAGRAHGFAIAARLKPDGDVGRVWSLSRPLTYRSLEQLAMRGHIRPVGQEPGIAGGNRTILAATRAGRGRLRAWLATPVVHLRDVRSELLLKLVVADVCGVDVRPMLERQHDEMRRLAETMRRRSDERPGDVVDLWRSESSAAAVRFLEALLRQRDRTTLDSGSGRSAP